MTQPTFDPSALINQIERIAKQSVEKETRYNNDIKDINKNETLFLPIRHFNSDTPITPGLIKSVPYNIAERPLNINYGGTVSLKPLLVGGGYFIWHKGEGIAIDPGYGFVDSLHCYHGFTVSQIDAIIITHDHMDHHADLETIFNLKKASGKLTIYTNQEVIDAYGLTERKKVRCSNIDVIPIHVKSENGNESIQITKNIKGIFLPAIHWQRVRKSFNNDPLKLLDMHLNTFGVQLILNDNVNVRILITGDTIFPNKIGNSFFATSKNDTSKIPYSDQQRAFQLGYWKQDVEENKKIFLEMINNRCKMMIKMYSQLERSDIVCLHIGSIKTELSEDISGFDLDNMEETINKQEFCYPGFHLGLTGMLRLMNMLLKNEKFDPKVGLIIITEFGEELLGNRQNICAIFSKLLSYLPVLRHEEEFLNNIAVLPSEVTLKIRLAENNIIEKGVICSYCQMLHKWVDVSGIEGPGEIISFAATGSKNNVHTNCAHWVV